METAGTQVGKGLPVAGTEGRPKRLRYEKAGGTLWDRVVQTMHLQWEAGSRDLVYTVRKKHAASGACVEEH